MPGPNETGGSPNRPVAEKKRALRREMRSMRKGLANRSERSEAIVEHLLGIEAVRAASCVLAYESVPGEVETSQLVAWCGSNGVGVVMPEDDELVPDRFDVIVVPGTAFTTSGARLGQGGGWYDRFLPLRRRDAVTIGLGFREQIVVDLPTEPHDVILDCVVTDDGAVWADG
ncbi:MAG: 5-formyltetrahydrofolate cyclo-ligase [Ilumatobacter sp.]